MEAQKFNSLLKTIREDRNAFTVLYDYYFPRIALRIANKYKAKP